MNYQTIKPEKGMYASSKGFSATLEELDPSEQYEGTALAGLDAYQRQLKRFDIKVAGYNSDTVEKFFATTDSAALFPEYVSRAVRQGAEQANLLGDLVATTTRIDSTDYRSIASVPDKNAKELKPVAEGSEIPQTKICVQDHLVKLNKRGRMLVASYEALRFQRLDLFTVTLRQIGAYIARQQFADAVNVLINGDGNSNAAPVQALLDSDAGLTYADLIKLWNSFEPYEMNTLVASPDAMSALLSIEEFKNPATGLNFQATGTLSSPLGAKMLKSNGVPEATLIALDKNCALEMVVADDIRVDYDKLIDRQLERAAITSIAGFAKIFTDASKVIKL